MRLHTITETDINRRNFLKSMGGIATAAAKGDFIGMITGLLTTIPKATKLTASIPVGMLGMGETTLEEVYKKLRQAGILTTRLGGTITNTLDNEGYGGEEWLVQAEFDANTLNKLIQTGQAKIIPTKRAKELITSIKHMLQWKDDPRFPKTTYHTDMIKQHQELLNGLIDFNIQIPSSEPISTRLDNTIHITNKPYNPQTEPEPRGLFAYWWENSGRYYDGGQITPTIANIFKKLKLNPPDPEWAYFDPKQVIDIWQEKSRNNLERTSQQKRNPRTRLRMGTTRRTTRTTRKNHPHPRRLHQRLPHAPTIRKLQQKT